MQSTASSVLNVLGCPNQLFAVDPIDHHTVSLQMPLVTVACMFERTSRHVRPLEKSPFVNVGSGCNGAPVLKTGMLLSTV